MVNDRAAFYYLTNEAAHLTVCFINIRKIDKKELRLKKDSCNIWKQSQKYIKNYLYFDYILLVQKNNNYEDLRNLSGVNLEKIIQTKSLKEDKAILYKVVK